MKQETQHMFSIESTEALVAFTSCHATYSHTGVNYLVFNLANKMK